MTDRPSHRRRAVLTASAAGVASLAGCGNPFSGPEEESGNSTRENGSTGVGDDLETFRLGGETGGWVGIEPETISDETNPTIELQSGNSYEIAWENRDGEEHELIITDENGDEIHATDSSEETGEVRSLQITAAEGLGEYFCEYHADSMRGDIEVVGES